MPATRHDRRIRLPRTTNERRAYEPQIEDIFRTDKDDISWKNNGYGIKRRRKKQWM